MRNVSYRNTLVAIMPDTHMRINMNKIRLLLILLSINNLIFSQDLLFNGKYSDKPVVDSGLKIRLTDLKEPIINELEMCDGCEMYRFTWLRTFDNPICIRLERKNDLFKLVYKIGYGAGGYEPKGLKKTKSIKILKTEWDYFVKLLYQTGLDTIPNRFYLPMTDGASWILEQRTGFEYKGHKTNSPSSNFEICCLYLLELANIDYNKDAFNLSYANQRIYLDKQNRLIKEDLLKDTILVYLNAYIADNKLKNDWCYYDDLIFTINARGKIVKIKPPREDSWIEDKIWEFESRSCRRAYKKELKKLDLSYLNLKSKIKINIELEYDKEKNILKITD